MKSKGIFTQLLILALAIAVIVMLLSFKVTRPETNQTPYIYYYSAEVNSLVIERADGSDSRRFAPDLMPEDDDIIRQIDWSPSGRWLAWRSLHYYSYSSSASTLSIVRSDGTDPIQLLPNDIDVCTALWAVDKDILFVSYLNRSLGQMVHAFIDVEAGTLDTKFIASPYFYGNRCYEASLTSGWMDDETVVITSPTWLVTVPLNGEINYYHKIKVDSFEVSHYSDARFIFVDGAGIDEYCLYITRAWIQDLSTKRQIDIENNIEEDYGDAIRYEANWNPQGTAALLRQEHCSHTSKGYEYTALYLLNWETGEQTPLSNTLNWTHNRTYPSDAWSPDGNYAVLADVDSNYHLLSVQNGIVRPLPEGTIQWHWKDDNTLILLSTTGDILEYDLAWGTANVLFHAENAMKLHVSPNGQFIAPSSYYSKMFTMFDTYQHEYWTGMVHTAALEAIGWLDWIKWHHSGEWFITSEDATYAGGGGGGPNGNTVYHIDGSIRRELNLANGEVGFVPERAIPYLGRGQAQSVVKQPILTLPYDKDIIGIVWSPDGSQLITLSASSITVWEIQNTLAHLVSQFAIEVFCEWSECVDMMAWDDDGHLIVVSNGNLRLWDIEQGTLIEERPITETDETTLNQVYYPLSRDTSYVDLFQYVGGKVDSTISRELIMDDHNYDFHLNAGFVASSSPFKHVNLWDVRNPVELTQLNVTGRDLAFHPVLPRLAVASRRSVTIWDIDSP